MTATAAKTNAGPSVPSALRQAQSPADRGVGWCMGQACPSACVHVHATAGASATALAHSASGPSESPAS
jgi:hypothetical protein